MSKRGRRGDDRHPTLTVARFLDFLITRTPPVQHLFQQVRPSGAAAIEISFFRGREAADGTMEMVSQPFTIRCSRLTERIRIVDLSLLMKIYGFTKGELERFFADDS